MKLRNMLDKLQAPRYLSFEYWLSGRGDEHPLLPEVLNKVNSLTANNVKFLI